MSHQQMHQQTTTIKKEEKLTTGLITPKPIEQLMMQPSAYRNQQENLKNASSWSSLASGSPQNTQTSTKSKPSAEIFQAFRNKAKEKADRMKLLEQQESKRVQKEQAEKEQMIKRQQQQDMKIKHEDMNNGR